MLTVMVTFKLAYTTHFAKIRIALGLYLLPCKALLFSGKM